MSVRLNRLCHFALSKVWSGSSRKAFKCSSNVSSYHCLDQLLIVCHRLWSSDQQMGKWLLVSADYVIFQLRTPFSLFFHDRCDQILVANILISDMIMTCHATGPIQHVHFNYLDMPFIVLFRFNLRPCCMRRPFHFWTSSSRSALVWKARKISSAYIRVKGVGRWRSDERALS